MTRMPTDRPFRYRLLLMVGTWLLGVGVAMPVGFGALGMIGGEVTDRATTPLSERAVRVAAAQLSDAPDPADPADPADPGDASDGAGSADPADPAIAGPAGSASGRASAPRNGDRGGSTADTPGRSPSRGSAARPPAGGSSRPTRVRSFPSVAGVAAASCLRGKVALRYAVPRDGYRSHVFDRGPYRVMVQFDGRKKRVRITIRCTSGVATATIRDRAQGAGDNR
jgi:hypothetical protein